MSTGERVGRNEAVFREVNEEINELGGRLGLDDERMAFVCECSAPGCDESVELTRSEYEEVRRNPTHFLIAIGHLWEPEVEREVYRTERFAVVEKLGGAAEEAASRDPRNP